MLFPVNCYIHIYACTYYVYSLQERITVKSRTW